MRKTGKKMLSLALALCMALALLSTAAFAAGQEYHPQTGAELEALLPCCETSNVPSGATIYLEAKEYQLQDGLWIENVDDLSIIGQPGTKLVLDIGWGNDTVKDLAYSSTQSVTVDGKPVEFQMYALKDAKGNDSNYIKLRDMAYILNGTKAQFSVDWNGSISLTPGAAYKANGSEMSTPFSGNRPYKGGPQTLKVSGKDVTLDALVLTDDAGSGYTYFKLRDLGSALGFKVDWDAKKGAIVVETGGAAQTPTQPEADGLTAEVIRLVNAERAKEGLAPLETFDSLTQAAAIRAPELAESFSHTRPDGSSCSTALDETGASRGAHVIGENIAYGQSTAAGVVAAWMNSPGHRANILNPDFTHIGVGHFTAPGGQHYWVQVFVGK